MAGRAIAAAAVVVVALVAVFPAIRLSSALRYPSRGRLGIRTMVIDFGSVKGRISVD
jgi:hypothetical protein